MTTRRRLFALLGGAATAPMELAAAVRDVVSVTVVGPGTASVTIISPAQAQTGIPLAWTWANRLPDLKAFDWAGYDKPLPGHDGPRLADPGDPTA